MSVAKSCLKPETAPLTLLAIKRGFLCNFAITLKGRLFMGHSGMGWKFSITIVCKSSKLSSYSLLKYLF